MKNKKISRMSITKRIKEDRKGMNIEEDILKIEELLKCIGAQDRALRDMWENEKAKEN